MERKSEDVVFEGHEKSMMKSRMRQLSLKLFPDEVLRQVCEPVERFDTELRDLLDEMRVLMRTHNGIGLAAPQVGITKRLFVCGIEDQTISLVNPEILDVDGKAGMIEGCLSLPDVEVNVTRNEHLHLRGYDARGRKKQFRMDGLWARVAQHEMDHLDGVLICDHGENLKTEQGVKDGS